ncbi:hypothetical protein L7F22_017775 [Adiantum nelumboides]|nr:hypothetical protein [Adiantum nelumboides]
MKDEKQELDEALQSIQKEIHAAFWTNEIRRTPSAPQDEMRARMSSFHETIWNGLPKFLCRVDTALKSIGVNETLPQSVPLIQSSSWMGGDRDGNPRVTQSCQCGMVAVSFEHKSMKLLLLKRKEPKYYMEFWKPIPPNEPFTVLEICVTNCTNGSLLDVLRQFSCFGLSLVKLDIRQKFERHSDVMDTITQHLEDLPVTNEVAEVLNTFTVVVELPHDCFGAYIIAMATAPSDVLVVELLQCECHIAKPLRVVPLFEELDDLINALAYLALLFANDWYRNKINGQQEVMLGYTDSGKDTGRLSVAWQVFKTQEDCVKVAQQIGIKLTLFHERGGSVGRGGGSTLAILSQSPDTIHGSLQVTIQGEVIEQSFGEEHLCFRKMLIWPDCRMHLTGEGPGN